MGEQPQRVFNVGEVGLDQLRTVQFLNRQELEKGLNFSFKKRNLLITFHPVTLAKLGDSLKQLKVLLQVLENLKDTQLIFTKANADPEGRRMNKLLGTFVSSHKDRSVLFSSLGSLRYLSLMKQVDALIGNSSSALVEAPSLHVAAVNIGDRQKGRLKTTNVIDCVPTKAGISSAIARVYSKDFRQRLKKVRNPYGDGHSSSRILKVLKSINLENLVVKKFYDY